MEDSFWTAVLGFLRRHSSEGDRILAPKEFLEEMPGIFGYGIVYAFPIRFFSLVVLHKGMYHYFPLKILEDLRESYVPLFANEVFVVLSSRPRRGISCLSDIHYLSFTRALPSIRREREEKGERPGGAEAGGSCASVVTTFNRPEALARALPQIVRAGGAVVVVDDGSGEPQRRKNRETATACGAAYVELPVNRGLAAAINTGVSWWLADMEIEWISCFQDDVDVHPDIFSILRKVQDPADRPILTGRFSGRHPVFGSTTVNGEKIMLMRGISGQHIHCHRSYWREVLPVPSPYLGAPKEGGGLAGQGPEEDFWISAWSPGSITKKGGYVACVPGLVRAFLSSSDDSTWKRELGEEDGPLRASGG